MFFDKQICQINHNDFAILLSFKNWGEMNNIKSLNEIE